MVSYPVFDEEGNFEYNNYDCIIIEEIINYFKEHKSKNLQAINDFEKIIIPTNMCLHHEKLNYLSHIKISFESDPVLLTEGLAGPEIVRNDSNPTNSMSGYLISLNGNPIIGNQKGYYELSNTRITSFSVLCDCKITLDYVYNYTETAKENNQKAMRIEYVNRVG